jgi:hypothetical protein
MSPISLTLDLLMMGLLVAALGFGWRLERRLKTLRESHADFATAVADLDRAAQRAEAGLAELRKATDEAADLLAGRIEKARELAARLESASLRAAVAAPRPANDVARPVPARPSAVRPPQVAASRPAPVRSASEAVLAAEALARRLAGEDGLVLRTPAPTPGEVRPMRRPGSMERPIAPARPAIDDDLFVAPARAAMPGRR